MVEALPSPPPAETEKASDKGGRKAPWPPLPNLSRSCRRGRSRFGAMSPMARPRISTKGHCGCGRRAKALSGLGFVALDRGQLPAAYEFFKRALAGKSSLAPALFGWPKSTAPATRGARPANLPAPTCSSGPKAVRPRLRGAK